MIKRVFVMALVVVTMLLSACATSDEPCGYCGDTPTKGYKTSNGEVFNVCSDCSSECAFCGEKATKHYTAGFGNEMFVCKECYDSMSE